MKSLKTLSFVLFALISSHLMLIAHGHGSKYKCVSGYHQSKVKMYKMDEMKEHEPEHARVLQQTAATYDNIRIVFDWSAYNTGVSAEMKKYMVESVGPVCINYLARRLKVKRLTSKLKFPTYMNGKCYDATVPQNIINTGLDGDIVFIVTHYTNKNDGVLAWAISCVQGPLGRPVFGQINVNLGYVKPTAEELEPIADTLMHEAMHAMGFAYDHFGEFVDENGKKRGLQNVVRHTTRASGAAINMIITPKVAQVAREYFNCPSAQGMEMENQRGKEGSHWERSLLWNEMMTASSMNNGALTKFTLAFFEDSGWYQAVYELAEEIYWGKNQGCDFMNKLCHQTPRPQEFCPTNNYDSLCTFDGIHKGQCMNDPFMKSDNCWAVFAFGSTGDCRKPGAKLLAGETRGPNSRCINSNIGNQWAGNNNEPKCYQIRCASGKVYITLNGDSNEVVCEKEGQILTVSGKYSGKITCPDPFTVCQQTHSSCPNSCSGYGYCHEGKCECRVGYKGSDCSQLDDGSNNGQCMNDCNNRGTCSDGKCTCNQGYYGLTCQYQQCPSQCSNQGTCNTLNGTCTCNQGYSGLDCSQKDQTNSTNCTNNCSGNGVCNNGVCTCNQGYTGSDCSIPPQPKPCLNNCSKQGKCINGMCQCNSGYTGNDCSVNETVQQCPNNCSNQGVCNNGVCECHEGFSGKDCSVKDTVQQCPNNCSNQGDCNNGVCECHDGFSGKDCSVKDTVQQCPNNCSNQGVCNNGVCECHDGFSGKDCSVKDTVKQCPNNCSNQGVCLDGNCDCNQGFTGQDCSQQDNQGGQCPNDCSYNGVCQNNKCTCFVGFQGNDCSGDNITKSNCPNDCNFLGTCDNGNCTCYYDYFGKDCALHNSTLGKCPNNCSGNGMCVEDWGSGRHVCMCYEGFRGRKCHKQKKRGGRGGNGGNGGNKPECKNNCNGNGECYDGFCYCHEGFYGRSCKKSESGRFLQQNCTLDCSNKGKCVNQKCQCKFPFVGKSCEYSLFNIFKNDPSYFHKIKQRIIAHKINHFQSN